MGRWEFFEAVQERERNVKVESALCEVVGIPPPLVFLGICQAPRPYTWLKYERENQGFLLSLSIFLVALLSLGAQLSGKSA